jgi:radical SAM superfamily enzyme YgiQ (UPF0313 family)
VIDGNIRKFTLENLIAEIKAFDPQLIVVNTGFPSIEDDMAVARALKHALPKCQVAAFGVFFTMLEKESLAAYPFLDFALVGEPEITFQELAAVLAGASRKPLADIPGLLFYKEKSLIQTAPRELLQNLDQLPIPDRNLLENSKYRLPHNDQPFALINSARGCPHRCTYCIVKTYYGRPVRKHSIPYVLREIKECMEKFGLRYFLFWEEAFTLNRRFVLDLTQAMIDAKLDIHWAATTRVKSLDEEVVQRMKAAGCYMLGLGIETSSQTILDLAKKQQTIADVEHAVALCRRYGLKTMGHFIFGLPGETRATAKATLKFMTRLGLDYMQSYCAVPYPKTELGEMAKAKDWIQARAWSEYDFGGNSIMRTDDLTCAEVDIFRQQAFTRFYFRPFYLLRKFFQDLSWKQWFKISMFAEWMHLLGWGKKKK